jgi:hypothetical protein
MYMPQISLIISHNIDIKPINFRAIFAEIHDVLGKVPTLDNRTCFSGVIQESYSYIGLGNEQATKVFLEVQWLESAERKTMKPALAAELMSILSAHLTPALQNQGLICQPRVKISNLGAIDHEYFIYRPGVGSNV